MIIELAGLSGTRGRRYGLVIKIYRRIIQLAGGRQFGGQLVPKGSITVDGVSLTVVEVKVDRFSVALIPHTVERT